MNTRKKYNDWKIDKKLDKGDNIYVNLIDLFDLINGLIPDQEKYVRSFIDNFYCRIKKTKGLIFNTYKKLSEEK